MSDQSVPLECGTGIINVFRAQDLSWKRMMSEWIDNSFGAGAKRITIRKTGSLLEIVDDGFGCDDLRAMQSLARSVKNTGNKASRYGIGGLMSQINASQAGMTEVSSTTREKKSHIVCDWRACLERDTLFANSFLEISAPSRKSKTGTTITIHNCKRIRDVDKLVRELGYRFSGMLNAGHSITLEIEEEPTKVKPFTHPPFSKEVAFEFKLDGCIVKGFCGLVERGTTNLFPGWSVHWGYRFLDRFHEPADGTPTNRIYGEIYLPQEWKNLSVTKDSFCEEPDDLWEVITEHCREIIDIAAEESQKVELAGASQAAEAIISGALIGKRMVKGARPGDTGKQGTVKPTGTGGDHKRFKTSQPGDKAPEDSPLPDRTPDRVRIVFDETMEDVYSIATSGKRVRTFVLTLNTGLVRIADFRDDPKKLATVCLGYIAREIADGADDIQRAFPSYREQSYQDIYRELLLRSDSPQEQEARPRFRPGARRREAAMAS